MALTLVIGNDEFLVNREIKKILATSINKLESTNAPIQLEAVELDLMQIGEYLSPSLFGAPPPLVVNNLQDIDQDLFETLNSLLSDADSEQIIMISHDGGVKGKGLVEKLKKIATNVISIEPLKTESSKLEFLANEFKSLKRKAAPESISALLNAVGDDPAELAAAASQLNSDLIPGKNIEISDIEKYYAGKAQLSGFDVADAVIARNQVAAISMVRKAITNGVEPIAICAALAAQVRAMAKVSSVAQSIKSFELAGELGMPPWQIDKARKALKNWTPKAFTKMVELIAILDMDLKGAAADPLYSLESTVLSLTDPEFR